MSADELMLNQSTWYYEQQSSLAEYFRSKGRDANVNTSWPLQ